MRVAQALAIVLSAQASAPALSAAEEYHPLAPGLTWHYENATGDSLDMAILGTEEIRGVTTVVRREIYPDQVVLNYWTDDPDGTLRLHGARNLTFPYQAFYSPPIRMVAPPLSLGHTWGPTVVEVCSEPEDTDPCGSISYTGAVVGDDNVTVPHGTFAAFGVAIEIDDVTPRGGRSFDLLGRAPGTTPTRVADTDWYADGVGIVRQDWVSSEIWELHETGTTTPVQTVRWTSLKARYAAP